MPLTVTVKTVSKEEYAVELPGASATVGELRKAAGEKMPIPAGGVLTLVHLGTVLADDAKSLQDHGIADGATLVAVIKKTKAAASPAGAGATVMTKEHAAAFEKVLPRCSLCARDAS